MLTRQVKEPRTQPLGFQLGQRSGSQVHPEAQQWVESKPAFPMFWFCFPGLTSFLLPALQSLSCGKRRLTLPLAPPQLHAANSSVHGKQLRTKPSSLLNKTFSAALMKVQLNTTSWVGLFLIVNRFSRSSSGEQIMRSVSQKESD